MDKLSEFEKILMDGVIYREKQLERYGELLVQSEDRIAKTNAMIDHMVEYLGRLTGEYSRHIDSLSASRDEVIKQNAELIKEVSVRSKEIEILNHQIDGLIKQLIIVCKGGNVNENNITLDK